MITYLFKLILAAAIVIGGGLYALERFTPSLDLVPSVAGEVATTATVEPVQLTIEAIDLDCKARVKAIVPIEGERQHKQLGVTYRTDRLSMTAQGDVDTCVDGGAAKITVAQSGATLVEIPASSIRFVRPRVDAIATADSVAVSKGYVGKVTDQAFWVSDDLGLTPGAYALAQSIIGSSECMGVAMDRTREIIRDAYRLEAIEQGIDPATLTVRIEGAVDLSPLNPDDHDFDVFKVGDVECQLVEGGDQS